MALVDSVAEQAVLERLVESSKPPVPREVAPPVEARKGRVPTVPERAILGMHDVMSNVVTQQMKAMETIPKMMDQALDMMTKLANVNPVDALSQPLSAPKTPFSITMGQGRSYAARTISLSGVKKICKLTGTKLNDVVMAICAGALRSYLDQKGKLPGSPLIAFVPISIRESGNTDMNNQVSGMNVPLATLADMVSRTCSL